MSGKLKKKSFIESSLEGLQQHMENVCKFCICRFKALVQPFS